MELSIGFVPPSNREVPLFDHQAPIQLEILVATPKPCAWIACFENLDIHSRIVVADNHAYVIEVWLELPVSFPFKFGNNLFAARNIVGLVSRAMLVVHGTFEPKRAGACS